jgi:hypothetical protein
MTAFGSCCGYFHIFVAAFKCATSFLQFIPPYTVTVLCDSRTTLFHATAGTVEHGLIGCNRASWHILRENRGAEYAQRPQHISTARRLLLTPVMVRTRYLVKKLQQLLIRCLKWKWMLSPSPDNSQQQCQEWKSCYCWNEERQTFVEKWQSWIRR